MIGHSSGKFLVLPFGVGLLMVLTSAYAAWRSATRKDAAMAMKSVGGLVLGSWFICSGLGVIPRDLVVWLSLYAFAASILLIVGGHLLVSPRGALPELVLWLLMFTLTLVGALGVLLLIGTHEPLFHAGLLITVLLAGLVVQLVRKRRRRGP